jgi:hypothetical protein
VVEVPFALIFGAGAIVVAALEAGLVGLVRWRKSIIAAAVLFAVAVAATYFVLAAVFRHDSPLAAWALVACLVGVWAGGSAVHCTVAFRRLTA